jgi:hypothetical protein
MIRENREDRGVRKRKEKEKERKRPKKTERSLTVLSPFTWVHWSPITKLLVMIKLKGELVRCYRISVIIQFQGLMTTIYGICKRLYMVIMPIYGKWQNVPGTYFISLLVLHQSEFPLANRILSSNGAF